MIIEQPSKWLRWLYPKALWRMDETDHSVYLTFDDGPIPESTPTILKILREFDVKATFFVVGDNVRKYPELFQQIIDEGHHIGNHTFNHMGGAKHTIGTYRANIIKCQEIITSPQFHYPQQTSSPLTNSKTNYPLPSGKEGDSLPLPLFRPPHGWMRPAQYELLKKKYRIVMWDLVTRDYSHLLNSYDVMRNVRHFARNGSIITFHDSLKSIDKLFFALPASLRWLKAQGFEFKTL